LLVRVHIQHSNCGSANIALADDKVAAPFKVLCPPVTPGMEQGCDGLGCRINPREVSAFVQIAINTGQGEIVEGIATAVLAGNDVLYMKGG
jgi:hypothetical protein